MTTKKKKKLKVIGRVDKADFPEFNLLDIPVKIDTGAFTSSIHCDYIEELIIENKKQLLFKFIKYDNNLSRNLELFSYNYTLKNIKSSNALYEERYVIESSIVLFGKTHPIQLTLSDRSGMRYPILLGRKLLKNRFTVDVSRKNLSYKRKLKQCI